MKSGEELGTHGQCFLEGSLEAQRFLRCLPRATHAFKGNPAGQKGVVGMTMGRDIGQRLAFLLVEANLR